MHRLGPYEFSDTDAVRTVANFPALWDELTLGRDADVVAHLWPDLDGDVDEVLPRVWSALLAAGAAYRAAGVLPSATGTVAHLHRNDGGVPKLPVDEVEVGWRGVVGDRQRSRQHHGRPWQALCLWAGEVIDAFATDGHPIGHGSAGENVTLRGLSWADVRPGTRLRLGTVLCEVSAWALPCKHNARWFSDGDFMRMHHGRGPVSRAYATVLEPGTIRVGDDAVLH
ncbi:MAG: MOSC domain-containing protein [Acidimicrobiales bacterium]|nr:MOSC domain-containing protein [Acidimicrobiales bacterium]MCB9395084.1 MOSC domain-containing protein [Acidimicrobiaceae bacterium]